MKSFEIEYRQALINIQALSLEMNYAYENMNLNLIKSFMEKIVNQTQILED